MSWRVRPCLFVLPLLVLSVPSLAQVAWVKKYDDALKQAADRSPISSRSTGRKRACMSAGCWRKNRITLALAS